MHLYKYSDSIAISFQRWIYRMRFGKKNCYQIFDKASQSSLSLLGRVQNHLRDHAGVDFFSIDATIPSHIIGKKKGPDNFIQRTVTYCNWLPTGCFLDHYHLNIFKLRSNHYGLPKAAFSKRLTWGILGPCSRWGFSKIIASDLYQDFYMKSVYFIQTKRPDTAVVTKKSWNYVTKMQQYLENR